MEEVVLQLQNISKYYYSDTSVTQALHRINLEFHMGEFVAITGESGSGKSTLLNMISGLDTFDEGEMYYRGQPTFQYDDRDWEEYRRNSIGFVFQDYSLINHYSALDNVLAALVIQGKEGETARQEALSYLEQVGLQDLAKQRASQLSSGQKQRLSIARALAKNTDVIVADEPTGNLDSETGEQVIEILKKLSRTKLVIMVTHNYDQAAPYVTRRIRLHDGEVVTDALVNHQNVDSPSENVNKKDDFGGDGESDTKNNDKETTSNPKHLANFFSSRNIKTLPGRSFLFFCFFFITAAASFVFIGEILLYRDDRITKEYDTEGYLQQNDTRLVVRHPDGSVMTEKDQESIEQLKYVEEVDLYDYANDINYYIREGTDYKTVFGDQVLKKDSDGSSKDVDYEKVQGITLLDSSHFMRSSAALKTSDLSQGRLPEKRGEIVLYSTDKKELGSTLECYFSSDNLWEPGESCHQTLTVVGLLKEKTDQVYFHPELCQMLTIQLDKIELTGEFCYDFRYKRYMGSFSPCTIVVGDDLEENQVRVSKYFELPSTGYGVLPSNKEDAFTSQGLLHISRKTETGEEETDQNAEDETSEQTYDISYVEDFGNQGADFIEVSEELYQKLREYYDKGSTQGSVYIKNYSKTNKVLSALQKLGYDGISTYQVSTTKYIEEKVYQRLEVIGISCLVLAGLALLQVLVLRSILMIKKKDYGVLKFMGMQMREMRGIAYEEMGFLCIAAVAASLLVMAVLWLFRVSFFQEIIAYYNMPGLLLYLFYNLFLMAMTVFFFHRKITVFLNPVRQ